MMYGYLDENYIPVFVKSVAGNVIASAYVIVFYRSTKDRASVHNVLAIAGFVIVATSLYVILGGLGYTGQTRHQAAQVAGIMANVTGMFMYGSPLVKIVQVFKYKSAVFIPVHMVCMGATNNMIWITYSILSSKGLILVPAAGAFCLSIFQVILYLFIYNPSTHPLPADFVETKAAEKSHAEASLSVEIDSPGAHKTDFVALNSTRSPASQQHNQH
jgi:solute carrier family 50 protein (sugar transporter)